MYRSVSGCNWYEEIQNEKENRQISPRRTNTREHGPNFFNNNFQVTLQVARVSCGTFDTHAHRLYTSLTSRFYNCGKAAHAVLMCVSACHTWGCACAFNRNSYRRVTTAQENEICSRYSPYETVHCSVIATVQYSGIVYWMLEEQTQWIVNEKAKW